MRRLPHAQCPSCEAQDFRPSRSSHLLACNGCGAEVHRAQLLSQVARHACLDAAALAQLLQRARFLVN